MDYAPLVEAIQEGDQEAANRLISEATPILIRMLKARMNASQQDAEDAVQMMFLYIINSIREGKIRNPSGLLSYMIVTCRHSYLKNRDGLKADLPGEDLEEPVQEECQLTRLINQEKERIYEECIESLPDDQREFIRYWLSHPDSSAREIGEHFEISENNAWTRKHRIMKRLRACYESKF